MESYYNDTNMNYYLIFVAAINDGKQGAWINTHNKIQARNRGSAIRKAEVIYPGKAIKAELTVP